MKAEPDDLQPPSFDRSGAPPERCADSRDESGRRRSVRSGRPGPRSRTPSTSGRRAGRWCAHSTAARRDEPPSAVADVGRRGSRIGGVEAFDDPVPTAVTAAGRDRTDGAASASGRSEHMVRLDLNPDDRPSSRGDQVEVGAVPIGNETSASDARSHSIAEASPRSPWRLRLIRRSRHADEHRSPRRAQGALDVRAQCPFFFAFLTFALRLAFAVLPSSPTTISLTLYLPALR